MFWRGIHYFDLYLPWREHCLGDDQAKFCGQVEDVAVAAVADVLCHGEDLMVSAVGS